MKERVPVEVFPPGDFIREEIEARGWTQEDLAEIINRPMRTINEVITGKRGITTETAKGLGEAFGTSAQLWMNLESIYRLSLSVTRQAPIARRAAIYEKAPIRAMVKRNWIEYSNNIDVLEQRLLDFYGLKNINEQPQFCHVARKSTAYTELTSAQIAWIFRAKNLSTAVSASHFTQGSLNKGLEKLKLLLSNEQDIRTVPKILSDSGIKFIIIEPLPQSKIDGVCFWINGLPVIALSLRYDRLDYFWHTLMHEIGHIKNKDGLNNNNFPIDIGLFEKQGKSNEDKPEYEKMADNFAIEFLVPQAELDNLIVRTRPLYSKKRIMGFASRVNIHPAIVVGQLQYRDEISYSQNREILVKVRQIITRAALTDGWGYSLPPNL